MNKYPYHPFPNSWYQLAFSEKVNLGKMLAVRALGQDLVVYCPSDGKAHVFEAHCPHLGANLAVGGRVVEDCLECPFHGWLYDRSGKCVRVPYASKVPANAVRRGFHVAEVNGVIFGWHHDRGEPSSFDVPEFPEFSSLRRSYRFEAEVHGTNLFPHAENILDATHFVRVHGLPEVPEMDVRWE